MQVSCINKGVSMRVLLTNLKFMSYIKPFIAFGILALFFTASFQKAYAHETHIDDQAHEDFIYYWGSYKASLSPAVKCAVRILNTSSTDPIEMEALVFQSHSRSYYYTDILTMDFSKEHNAFAFISTESLPDIKQAVLFLNTQNQPERLALSVLHHNHYDSALCNGLTLAQGTAKDEAQAFFISESHSPNPAGGEHEHEHEHFN